MKCYLLISLISTCCVFFSANAQPTYTSLEGAFGQPVQQISELTDVLHNATTRFAVTPSVPGLFSGNINGPSWFIAPGASETMTIDFQAKGEVGSQGVIYPEGYVYISFYYTQTPQSIQGRIKDVNGNWFPLSWWTDISNRSDCSVFRGSVPPNNFIVALELTINAKPNVVAWINKIEYHRSRVEQDLSAAYVTKYRSNRFYQPIQFMGADNAVNVSILPDGNSFFNGTLGIGATDTKGYKLAVNGNAIFNKVVVKAYASWPDYVFSRDYQLPPLEEVEEYIHRHAHLPGVPSAREVQETGLDIGENQALLLKKIEELTLYIIEQNKRIAKLEADNKTSEIKKTNDDRK